MTYRDLLSCILFSSAVALSGCSPTGTGGPDHTAPGDAGAGGSDQDPSRPNGSDPRDPDSNDSSSDGSDSGDSGFDDQGSDGPTGDQDPSTADAGAPTGSGGGSGPDPATNETNAHIDDSCNLDVFAGFVLSIFENMTTCDERWFDGGDMIQVTIGESTGAPHDDGRTYTIVPDTGDALYPADGEATGAFFDPGGTPLVSGTLTIATDEDGTFSGNYDVMLDDGTSKTGIFKAVRCPSDPGDCQ